MSRDAVTIWPFSVYLTAFPSRLVTICRSLIGSPAQAVGTVGPMSQIVPNAPWALDFQFDATVDGHQVKLLKIIDEYTRECLAIVVDRSIDAHRVVGTLARLAIERGRPPAFVRFDNGPSSSRPPLPTGATTPVSTRCSSIPARHGRTPGSSRSTAGHATSS